MTKNLIEETRAPWINIVVNYCCMRVLLYAKMLKEAKTEETIVFFVTFLSLVAFQLGGARVPSLATPMVDRMPTAEMETGRVAGRVEILRPAGQAG